MTSLPSPMPSSDQAGALPTAAASNSGKNSPGRGAAIVVYMLFLGSVLAVVTAPVGVLIAHIKKNNAEEWVVSHLQFQIRTFWLGLIGGILFAVAWQLLGLTGLPAIASWALGYGYFTACLIWMVGRCGVGITRLTNNRPVANPSSLAFGGARVTLAER
ncbi:hypothetical protein QEN58_08930 [Halomonas alkaliantarctica]|uniref:Uncharacterized protein n=1 Tax=Halomonas alkaliantarctica TaxID=232346 RepID=A0ABY8LUA7_9GAMM|nr:hypothetical protein [Halomonas alkaliantarctica]WGI27172.1 hypothetical protein QEN58_08930 [Halomonas alkaliantarctica]